VLFRWRLRGDEPQALLPLLYGVLARLSLFTGRCLGNVAVQRDSARPGLQPPAARNGTEQTPLPLLLRNVYSVAGRLAVGYLATLCCAIQHWVDMSQYFKVFRTANVAVEELCNKYLEFSQI
jgi:hypothetical protein